MTIGRSRARRIIVITRPARYGVRWCACACTNAPTRSISVVINQCARPRKCHVNRGRCVFLCFERDAAAASEIIIFGQIYCSGKTRLPFNDCNNTVAWSLCTLHYNVHVRGRSKNSIHLGGDTFSNFNHVFLLFPERKVVRIGAPKCLVGKMLLFFFRLTKVVWKQKRTF